MRFSSIAVSALSLTTFVACERRDQSERTDQPVAPAETAAREPSVEEEREPVRGREQEPAERPVNKRVLRANAAAADAIATASCQREARCKNIGAGKRFESNQVCLTGIGREWSDELDFDDCRGGVVKKELDECLAEIRNDDCGNPFDDLGRILACRESDLCKSTR